MDDDRTAVTGRVIQFIPVVYRGELEPRGASCLTDPRLEVESRARAQTPAFWAGSFLGSHCLSKKLSTCPTWVMPMKRPSFNSH